MFHEPEGGLFEVEVGSKDPSGEDVVAEQLSFLSGVVEPLVNVGVKVITLELRFVSRGFADFGGQVLEREGPGNLS